MKNILFLEQYSEIWGGQRVLLNLLAFLKASSDCAMTVAVPAEGELSKELGRLSIPYVVYPLGFYKVGEKTFLDVGRHLWDTVRCYFCLRSIIKEHGIQLIYANGPRTFLISAVFAISPFSRLAAIWHLHVILGKSWYLRFLLRLATSRKIGGIIVPSKAAATSVTSTYDKISRKIIVIYNGIDAGFDVGSWPKNEVRSELGVMEGAVLVGVVGRTTRSKGVETIVGAARLLWSRGLRYKFVVVGGSSDELGDRQFVDEIYSLVNANNLGQAFHWVGKKGYSEMPKLFNCLDIVVVPSLGEEAFSLVIAEAMCCGVPVIAARGGSCSEIIDNGVTGVLFRASDAMELAEKIQLLADNKDLRERIGRKAYAMAKEQFDCDSFARKIMSVIEHVA